MCMTDRTPAKPLDFGTAPPTLPTDPENTNKEGTRAYAKLTKPIHVDNDMVNSRLR